LLASKRTNLEALVPAQEKNRTPLMENFVRKGFINRLSYLADVLTT
jgi:hypothetical protein